MGQPDAWRMIRKRAAAAGIAEEICCHTFRATGITAYLASATGHCAPTAVHLRLGPARLAPEPATHRELFDRLCRLGICFRYVMRASRSVSDSTAGETRAFAAAATFVLLSDRAPMRGFPLQSCSRSRPSAARDRAQSLKRHRRSGDDREDIGLRKPLLHAWPVRQPAMSH